ncbi:hypothetical protein, partial [Accumulibacter sp.]|uniref:hypothetical protein n=1 Tax=Accumulibacter sp. TaxID=2053492 RepID=UPI0025E91034
MAIGHRCRASELPKRECIGRRDAYGLPSEIEGNRKVVETLQLLDDLQDMRDVEPLARVIKQVPGCLPQMSQPFESAAKVTERLAEERAEGDVLRIGVQGRLKTAGGIV